MSGGDCGSGWRQVGGGESEAAGEAVVGFPRIAFGVPSMSLAM